MRATAGLFGSHGGEKTESKLRNKGTKINYVIQSNKEINENPLWARRLTS